MNVDKWIEQKRMHSGITYNGDDVYAINVEEIRKLLKTHAIIPRNLNDELCKNVNKQSCSYISDMKVKTILKFIINAVESE